MLEAENLQRTYQLGHVQLEVLRGVSLRIERGEFVAITGPSGAGKSTLLHLLAGLDRPTAGDVRYEGRSLPAMSEVERARFRNRTIGIVFQFYHLSPELSALENAMLPGLMARPVNRPAAEARASERLEQVGLSARARHKPSELSGGERQRVAIARALMNDPQLLLCDEPTGNLDWTTGQEVVRHLLEARRRHRMTLVLVTHESRLAELADRVIALQDGRIIAPATPVAQRSRGT